MVVFRFFWFSSWMGVPVKPNSIAVGNVLLIVCIMSPKVERWHSSTMKTMRLLRMRSRSRSVSPSSCSWILLIFWMDVTMSVSAGSLLMSLFLRTSVSSVACTLVESSAKLRYSSSDCVPSSILSTRKTTLSASCESEMSWALLKLVMVLPEPVVCHTKPPRALCLSHEERLTLSEMAAAA